MPLLDGNCEFETTDGVKHKIDGKWDMIIAHPPCTYISNAGACRLYPKKGQLNIERFKKGLEAKEFFLKFLNADCLHIAVENPVHSKVFEMPLYTQEIQPYHFGHPVSKKNKTVAKRTAVTCAYKYCGMQKHIFTVRHRAKNKSCLWLLQKG